MRGMDVEYVEQNQEFPDIADISDELYSAAAAAAEQDYQQFEQNRIVNEHGYSMCPNKKNISKLANINDQNYIHYQQGAGFHLLEKAASKLSERVYSKAGISDTDSGDNSSDLYGVENRQRKRPKNSFARSVAEINYNSADTYANRGEIYGFPNFAGFQPNRRTENDMVSDSSDDSDVPPGVANGNAFPKIGSAASNSSDNDFLPARDSDVANMLMNDSKSETEDQLDPSQIGAFKTFSSSDRKSASSLFKKTTMSPTGPGIGKKGKKSKKNDKKSSGLKISLASKAAKVRSLFKASPSKTGAVKKQKELALSKNTKKKIASAKNSLFKKSRKKGLESKKDSGGDKPGRKSKSDNALYCICRKPHNGRFMICCDRCDDWFHGSCVRVTASEGRALARSKATYICPPCRLKEQQVNAGPRKTTQRSQKLSLQVSSDENKKTDSPVLTPMETPKVRSAALLANNVHEFLSEKKVGRPPKKAVVIRTSVESPSKSSDSFSRVSPRKTPRRVSEDSSSTAEKSTRKSARLAGESSAESMDESPPSPKRAAPSSSKHPEKHEPNDNVSSEETQESPQTSRPTRGRPKKISVEVPKVSPAGVEKNKSKVGRRTAVLRNSKLINRDANEKMEEEETDEKKEKDEEETKDESCSPPKRWSPRKRDDDEDQNGTGSSNAGSSRGSQTGSSNVRTRGRQAETSYSQGSSNSSPTRRSSPRKKCNSYSAIVTSDSSRSREALSNLPTPDSEEDNNPTSWLGPCTYWTCITLEMAAALYAANLVFLSLSLKDQRRVPIRQNPNANTRPSFSAICSVTSSSAQSLVSSAAPSPVAVAS